MRRESNSVNEASIKFVGTMNHVIRLIAIDLDGTLLTSGQSVSPASRAAIQRAAQAGIQAILVTGRGSVGAETVLNMLEMDLPYISSAGSLIRSGKNGQVISRRPFQTPEQINEVIAYVRHHEAGLIADLPNGKLCWYGPDGLMDELDPLTAASARGSVRTFVPERDFDHPILKMSIAGEMDFLQAIEADVLKKLDALHHVYAGLQYIDLTAQGVDKGSALKIYAEHENISLTNIATIGDQPIDLSMFKIAGLSIAMGNAPEAIKAATNWIAPSNDQDGVAWTIDKILGAAASQP
jgi:Cof subfamily protein (haloacid dehalogenase superfamily)